MGWYSGYLKKTYDEAQVLPLDACTKYVIMSDCHRGTGNHYDNFLKNQHLYFAAMQHYYQRGFTYLELGDGDELWENRCMNQIEECHGDVFWLFSLMEKEKRIHQLAGNHDWQLRKERKHSIVLKAKAKTGHDIFLLHGHQVDFFNLVCWRLARFLVRYLWKPLEQMGINDPTSAARNYQRCHKTERKLMEFAQQQDIYLISGHTHRPRLVADQMNYMNCGSCVHPRCITALEIEGMKITLVKWYMANRKDMTLYVAREILVAPVSLLAEQQVDG